MRVMQNFHMRDIQTVMKCTAIYITNVRYAALSKSHLQCLSEKNFVHGS